MTCQPCFTASSLCEAIATARLLLSFTHSKCPSNLFYWRASDTRVEWKIRPVRMHSKVVSKADGRMSRMKVRPHAKDDQKLPTCASKMH
eukprot:4373969-Amphidinium_carterae.1